MRRDTRPAGRAGFTLVELLVVIAILAVLAALIAAGISRVKESAQGNVTNQTLTKLQLAVQGQWKAVCDQCRDDRRTYATPNKNKQFADLVEICDRDVDRAEALWMFMNLRRAMPQTFAEARTAVAVTNGTLTVSLPPSSAFKDIQTNAAAKGNNPIEESAALLYLILTQGSRGNAFALDDAMQGAQMTVTYSGGLTLPAFKDAYGTYIAFQRFYQNAELDAPPYVRYRDAKMIQAGQQKIDDPLDPVGRLFFWQNTAVKTQAQTACGTVFNGKNRIATVISAGADARDLTDPQKWQAFDLTGATDDAFGYRLLTQGAKGE